MIYEKPANYTQDMKATVAKPSPRGDGHDVIEVEPKDAEGNQLFTGENPGVVTVNGNLPALSAGTNLIGKVEIAKVTPTIVTVRNQSIAAGAFVALGTFLASDGIKTISGSFRSPDNAFSNAFYIAHVGADGISLSTVYGAATSKRDSSFTGNMCSAKATVYFNNADTVAHVINADIVGFPN